MCYSIGDKVIGIINKIQDDGFYCSIKGTKDYGFLPKKSAKSFYDDAETFVKKLQDQVELYVQKIDSKGFIFFQDETAYKKKLFAQTYQIGTIFEAEVVSVQNSKVSINVGGIQGVIKKEDTNWNEIDRLEDLLFEGETINAVYIKYERGQIFFSLKLLNEKPYDDNLYDLSVSDLLKFAGHDSKVFVGYAKQYYYGLFIENLYSVSDNQKGKLLIDPIFGYNLRAIVPNTNSNVEENKYYRIELRLAPRDRRKERNQLFQFTAVNIEETRNPYKEDVEMTFAKSTSPRDCAALAHTLVEVGKNMYSSKDRMFFELVQNADDAAAQKGVYVNVKAKGDFLVVRHNGKSFDKDDFDAITSSASGTKKANENKTGYKGIGFKSVFTDSEVVFIKTGGYQFKFDRTDPRFTNFEDFYFQVNECCTEQQKNDFRLKFASERSKFKGVSDIPWQLEPIWVDDFPEELGEDFTNSNVNIALKLGAFNILGDNGYGKAIADIISKPRFMLFLRNTKRIDFNGVSVSKSTKDGIITLKNSFDTNRIEFFKREDFEIEVNNKVFEENDINVRIVVEEKEASGKIIEAKFVDTHNHEIENIPKKIAVNNSTSISFAIPIDEDKKAILPNKESSDISMFAFLPTLVKDFKFPFYINANFILNPPREKILGDNPWNFYLMKKIAQCLVHWSASLNEKRDKNALNVLLPKYFEEDSADIKQLSKHFNTAYKSALENEAFILNHNDELVRQDGIIIDKTGLSDIVGADLFCRLLKTEKCLPSDKIDSEILEESIFENIEKQKFVDVIDTIANNSNFNDWYISASKEQRETLHKWIKDNNIKSHEDKLKYFVSNLPLFQFGYEYKSIIEIKGESSRVVTTEHVAPIKNILSKLGFVCSDNIFEIKNALFEFIETLDEQMLFDLIKKCDYSNLDFQERKSLFSALKAFNGVDDAKLKDLSLFKNMKGEFKSVGKLTVWNNSIPTWLNTYVLSQSERDPEIEQYLIPGDRTFQEIIQQNIHELKNVSVLAMYKCYSNEWNSNFTRKLIDDLGPTEELLCIVEKTDGLKHYFVEKYGLIQLTDSISKNSMEYRLIRLALTSDYNLERLKRSILIDNRSLSDFTTSNEVVVPVSDKEYVFPLCEILPSQTNNGIIDKIKMILSDIPNYEKLFATTRMSPANVYTQLNNLNNPAKIVFFICFNVSVKNFVHWNLTDVQFLEVISYCFVHDIDILKSYIQFLDNQRSIIGKFINSGEYTCDNERLEGVFPVIRNWADTEEKEKFLISLGVKGRLSDEIKRRKSFLNNEPISLPYSVNINQEICAFLSWCKTLQTPFVKNNQVMALKEMMSRLGIPTRYCLDDFAVAKEWDNTRYLQFVKNKLSIYCIESKMPKRCFFGQTHLYTEYVGDYAFLSENKLYINDENKNIDTVLMSVCDDMSVPFTKDDWTKIFMVSAETLTEKEAEIASKNKTIESLQKDIQDKDDLIGKYRAKFGDINEHDTSWLPQTPPKTIPDVTITKGDVSTLSRNEKNEAQLEAQKHLIEEMKGLWYFPEGYGDCDEDGNPNYFSTIEIIDGNGDVNPIVLKSYKKQSESFKINTEEWDSIVKNGADLLIYDGNSIKKYEISDLIRNQSSVAITFSTENLDIEERINAFSDSLHYFNELHFDFNSFNVSAKAKVIADIYKKNNRKQYENRNPEADI